MRSYNLSAAFTMPENFTLQVSVFPDPAGPEGAPPSFKFSALNNVIMARSVKGVITRRLVLPKYSKP